MQGSRAQFINDVAAKCSVFFEQMNHHYQEMARRIRTQNDPQEKRGARDGNSIPREPAQIVQPQRSRGCQLFQSEQKQAMQLKFRAFNDFEIERLLLREWNLLDSSHRLVRISNNYRHIRERLKRTWEHPAW